MAALGDITFDCRHPAALARFWAAVLDGYAVAPYDEAEVTRLAGLGIDDPEDDPNVLVEAAGGPRLWFTQVPEGKLVKNRVHLDLRCADVEAESNRLVALGARFLSPWPDGEGIVMADPEGNEFCLVT
ncbi:MAG TPA: VOC family protein [Acidimicrobiales bacterium]|nr:VOC family protein [Acidimicrobiales bacterium]